ncbi:Clp protease N-terminal domain-containing protein [Actinophytocola sp. NPDC049390]|uniref:Clp protease N-terminal domain-containing protein n=1 Tax=Actinophytocola sp. NPDC049390 TaxID=3363894 RepID=UPI00378901A4
MFERFTADARTVVVRAQEEARDLGHDYIGTEHILLGLFATPTSVAARALRNLGVTAAAVRTGIEEKVGRGTAERVGHIPFTKRAKKALELSLREALQFKHNYIGTEHILLALQREGGGLAAELLTARIPDAGAVRAMVDDLLRDGVRERPAAEPAPRTNAAEEVVTAAQALAGDAPMGSHHLLEALIRAEGSMAAKVLADLGIDAAAIAAKVDEFDTEDTTDATPEEQAARKMELRVENDEVHLVFRDGGTVDLARAVTEAVGGPLTATGPVTGRFVPLWTTTNELLLSVLQTLKGEPLPEGTTRDKAALLVRRVLHDRLRRRGA